MNPTTAKLLFANPAGRLLADPDGFLHVVWGSGQRIAADMQALFEQVLVQLQLHHWSRVLIDQSAMRSFNGIEQTWVATDWLPRAVREGGYRAGAIIVSADVLARLATTFITAGAQTYPRFRSFDTEAEARHWLLQQPAQPSPLPAGLR